MRAHNRSPSAGRVILAVLGIHDARFVVSVSFSSRSSFSQLKSSIQISSNQAKALSCCFGRVPCRIAHSAVCTTFSDNLLHPNVLGRQTDPLIAIHHHPLSLAFCLRKLLLIYLSLTSSRVLHHRHPQQKDSPPLRAAFFFSHPFPHAQLNRLLPAGASPEPHYTLLSARFCGRLLVSVFRLSHSV
ncbi:hypothetical protein BJX64DRAFT_118182 [Aspergillus heterothallicus]